MSTRQIVSIYDDRTTWWLELDSDKPRSHPVRHRIDGPAIEWKSGDKMWWLNGEHMSEEEHEKAVKAMDSEQNATK